MTSASHVLAAPTLCVDLRQAAAILGNISIDAVRSFIANGDLATIKLPAVRGGESRRCRVLIAVSDIEAFVAKHREEATR
jgi:hypothetical protein